MHVLDSFSQFLSVGHGLVPFLALVETGERALHPRGVRGEQPLDELTVSALAGRVVVCVTHDDDVEQPGDTVVRLTARD